MENYNPKENEDRNEGCVDELGGPSLPKRPKSIEFSNAYNQDLDAISSFQRTWITLFVIITFHIYENISE